MLFLGAESRADQQQAYIALKQALACGRSEAAAITKADERLKEAVGIRSKHLFSENVYIRHERNAGGEFCVEGIVTQKGLERFDAELDGEHETIMGEIEDLNDGVSYAQKQAEVEALFEQVQAYNKKVAAAQKLGPVSSQQIAETKASLSKMINAIPVVKFRVDGCAGKRTAGCELLFISSFEDDSSQVRYRWEFGDGTVSVHRNPIHSYKTPGNYKVSLRITDGGKKYAVASSRVRIEAEVKQVHAEKPVADFSLPRDLFEVNEAVPFANLSSPLKSKSIQCYWDFGDGSSSQLCHPRHSYKKSGAFRVRLRVENGAGMTSQVEKGVRIVHPAMMSAADGLSFDRITDRFGQPDDVLVKAGASTQAYRYGEDWIIVKYNRVECRIKGERFKTNLLGSPKDCNWYDKHAKTAMYDALQ